MSANDEIEAFVKERNAALLADLDTFVAYAARRGKYFSDREVAEIALHKMRTAAKSLPLQIRRASRKWLTDRNYEPWDDGDLG